MLKLLIGGDVAPTTSNYSVFCNGKLNDLVGEELGAVLTNTDYSIFNLEVPLTDEKAPIFKAGPNLISPSSTVSGIKKISPYFYGLANNHIMDQGTQGLYSTMKLLESQGIAFAGAGRNANEATKPYIFEKNGIKVGIYCCAEYEFSIAKENIPGANWFDPLESLDHIVALRQKCDFLIVLYHGGKEHYRYPSPNLQRVCRKIVDKGADLVVCQHSHCIGCEEDWGQGKIVYGQGNFLFDHSDSEFWQTSLLVQADVVKDAAHISYTPICKDGNVVRLANEKESKAILEDFQQRSLDIQKEGFLVKEYRDFSEWMLKEYMTVFSGKIVRNPLYRVINKLSNYKWSPWVSSRRYQKLDRVIMQNYLECEAHRELIIEGLKHSLEEENTVKVSEGINHNEF